MDVRRSLIFGLYTFCVPLGLGILAGYYILGFPIYSSILLAGLFASQTLIAYNIGSFLPLKEINNGQYENYSGVFIIDNYGEYCLSGGTYLTFTYAGDYRQNVTYIPELLTYAARHGLVPDGPLLELIWVDNHQSADISEHITELQLRVYPKD